MDFGEVFTACFIGLCAVAVILGLTFIGVRGNDHADNIKKSLEGSCIQEHGYWTHGSCIPGPR